MKSRGNIIRTRFKKRTRHSNIQCSNNKLCINRQDISNRQNIYSGGRYIETREAFKFLLISLQSICGVDIPYYFVDRLFLSFNKH